MYIQILLAIIILLVVLLFLSLLKNSSLRAKEQENQNLRVELARSEEKANFFKSEKERIEDELKQERQKLLEINQSYESTRSYFRAQQEKIAEQKLEIERLQEKFNKEFELIAGKILEEKSVRFTETNKSNLDSLLNPLKDKIKSFEERVEKVYKSESDERNVLKGEISKLIELNKQISQEAHNLTRALKADSKKQGNWGEVVLDRILEASGLIAGESYQKQNSFTDEIGNRYQPDVLISLPDNKHLVIDSKVSLLAYERLVNCETDDDKIIYLNDHLFSIKNHIKNLSSKNYCDLYGINSPDFVLLFIPIESSFSIAVQHDVELFEFAWQKRVVVVTPSTLLATLKTIASIWKQEQQTRNAIDIATKAGALYDKFVGFVSDLQKIGSSLDKARDSYSEAFNKLSTGSGNLVGRVENLRKLGAKTSKVLEEKLLNNE
ncbi:DNA recombination protein RmuC [Pedobacter sp. SYSU D00535]|uniref:DNA recombination protein RmuC n=1 Tax=Pedobacter sp. SYSU D00535 TaxID=2810308 RepID=UPI001A972359|nr:DNA recombination protein RmuC [Pedobacter sp. SYSU D00535]